MIQTVTGLFTRGTISGWGLKAIYIHYAGVNCASTSAQTLFYCASGGSLYIKSNKIYFQVYAGKGETNGVWSWPCTQSEGRLVFTYWWYTTATDPTLHLNGQLLTVTEETTPSAIFGLTADRWYFGSMGYSATEPLKGRLGEIAFWDSVFDVLTPTQIVHLTTSKVKGMALQLGYNRLTHYWPLDDVPHGLCASSSLGTTGFYGAGLLPNADTSKVWHETPTSSAHYTVLKDPSDATYIYSDSTDDGETDTVGFETATVTKPIKFLALYVRAKGAAAGAFPYYQVKPGVFAITRSITATTVATYSDFIVMDFSQADIDAMEFWVTAQATIGKGDVGGYIYWVWVVPKYMDYPIYDRKSGLELLTFGDCGHAETVQSYM